MELRQLAYVVAVAETGSFTRAAQRCFVVQSALSEQVARLESELGVRLFERTSRRVQITPAGEGFLGPAREALAAAERARSEAVARSSEIRGSLVIGSIAPLTAVNLPDLLAAYRERHPAVRVTLRSSLVRDQLQQVRERTCDIAFVDIGTGELPRGFSGRVLKNDDLVAIVPHGHRLAGSAVVTPAQLAEEDMVDMPLRSGIRGHNDAAFAAAGVTRTVAFEADTTAMLEQLVARGLGLGVVFAAVAARMSTVDSIPTAGIASRTVQAVSLTSGISPAARAFLELLDEHR
ncbi:LysR family transcriptional regulator [Saccharopolyspora antimicrobica]|uniref:LysR family transcriptional regulator n=1 Tax=Saccharopolyspora antimicrobica TaxID=455193 RepID=UPI00147771C2|nr:LysR family transcriptional regulator [Saccharopolyspora antimicrobica]